MTKLRRRITGLSAGRVGRADSERGSALVITLGVIMIMTAVTVLFATQGIVGLRDSSTEAERQAAFAAARAGVDDYVAFLNEDDLYWTRAISTVGGPFANRAATGWAPVPGATDGSRFHYSVDASQAGIYGTIKVTSTGRSGDADRTVEVLVRKAKFIDFLYISDKELVDPAASPASYPNGQSQINACNVYSWQGGWNKRPSNCPNIFWRDGDVLDGDVHSNDMHYVSKNPNFKRGLSSGCPNRRAGDACYNKTLWVPNSTNGANPTLGQPPVGGTILALPPTNQELRRVADPSLGGNGCVYLGPTRILVKSNGKMDVTSPNTAASGACGPGTNLNLPPNGVIYVRTIPAGTPAYSQATSLRCARPWVRSPNASGTANSGGKDYPRTNDVTPYDCHNGDVFLEGTLKGQLTIGAENDIIITGDTQYSTGVTGSDVLGLIAQNFVRTYHPVTSKPSSNQTSSSLETCPNPCMQNLKVDGALLSVAHSVGVQNWDYGQNKGSLSVRGSIGQYFRGAVGTLNGTGYIKDYKYDPRLRYLSPPYFLDPVATAWKPLETAERANPSGLPS